MMNQIIYVFSESDKQKLIDNGYVLLKDSPKKSIFAFAMKDKMTFDMGELAEYMLSDKLTFDIDLGE